LFVADTKLHHSRLSTQSTSCIGKASSHDPSSWANVSLLLFRYLNVGPTIMAKQQLLFADQQNNTCEELASDVKVYLRTGHYE